MAAVALGRPGTLHARFEGRAELLFSLGVGTYLLALAGCAAHALIVPRRKNNHISLHAATFMVAASPCALRHTPGRHIGKLRRSQTGRALPGLGGSSELVATRDDSDGLGIHPVYVRRACATPSGAGSQSTYTV